MTPTIVTCVHRLSHVGGVERSTIEVSQALHNLGWDIHAVYEEPGPLERQWASFATLHRIEHMRFSLRSPLGLARTIRDMLTLDVPSGSVIYAHLPSHFEFAWALSRLIRGRLALHLRTTPRQRSARVRNAILAADARIAVSREAKAQWGCVYGITNVHVVPNGIDSEAFSRMPMNTSGATDPLRVLFLGRLEADKGFDIALESFSLALPQLPAGSQLNVVGEPGKSAEWAHQLLASAGPSIEYNGATMDIAGPLGNCDVLLMPSRVETFGRVAVEAMAFGVPVIGANIGGLPFLIEGIRANQIVDSGNVQSFAQALIGLSEARPIDDVLVNALRQRASEYSLDNTAKLIHEIFTAILPGQGRAS